MVGDAASELEAYESRFAKRLKPFADFQVIEVAQGRSRQREQRLQEEARHLLKQAGEGFVLFDEHGEGIDSVQWAKWLGRMSADARLDFVIGGADGVSAQVQQAAGHCWSLSRLTLPHQLARVLVMEQCYRAFTILAGHPYHRA